MGLLCVGSVVLLRDIREMMLVFLMRVCIRHGFRRFIRLSYPLDNPLPLHINLMYRFTGNIGSTVRNSISGIFFAITLRRIYAVFRLVLGLYIDILHPLPSHCAAVNRLYGSRNHIPGLNIRH